MSGYHHAPIPKNSAYGFFSPLLNLFNNEKNQTPLNRATPSITIPLNKTNMQSAALSSMMRIPPRAASVFLEKTARFKAWPVMVAGQESLDVYRKFPLIPSLGAHFKVGLPLSVIAPNGLLFLGPNFMPHPKPFTFCMQELELSERSNIDELNEAHRETLKLIGKVMNDLKKNTFLLATALIAMCFSCWVFAHPSNTAAYYSTTQKQLPPVQMPEDFYIVLANGLYDPGILPRLFSWTVLKNLVDQDTYQNRIIICNATGLFITGEQYVERIKQAVHQKIIEQDGRHSAQVLYIGISFGAPSVAQAAVQLEPDGIQASAMVTVNGVISGSLADYIPSIVPVIKELRTDSPFLQHAETAFSTLSQEQVQMLHFTGQPDWLVSTKQSTAQADALRENRQNKKIFFATPINHFVSWMAPSLHHELREMISRIEVAHSVTPVIPLSVME